MRARQTLAAEPFARAGRGSPPGERRRLDVRVRAAAVPAGPDGPFGFTAAIRDRDIGHIQVDLSGRSEIAIHDLAVVPSLRGVGVGAALVRAALSFGARAGRTCARLEAQDDGSGRLVRWYQGLGFTPAGTSPRGLPAMQADIRRALAWTRQRERTAHVTTKRGTPPWSTPT